jgi:hypothetical protein
LHGNDGDLGSLGNRKGGPSLLADWGMKGCRKGGPSLVTDWGMRRRNRGLFGLERAAMLGSGVLG